MASETRPHLLWLEFVSVTCKSHGLCFELIGTIKNHIHETFHKSQRDQFFLMENEKI